MLSIATKWAPVVKVPLGALREQVGCVTHRTSKDLHMKATQPTEAKELHRLAVKQTREASC